MAEGRAVQRLLTGALAGAAVVALASLWGGAARPARAQDGEAAKAASLEYRVVDLRPAEYATLKEWKEELDRAKGDARRALSPFLERILNALASEGWRLVEVLGPDETPKLIFERARR